MEVIRQQRRLNGQLHFVATWQLVAQDLRYGWQLAGIAHAHWLGADGAARGYTALVYLHAVVVVGTIIQTQEARLPGEQRAAGAAASSRSTQQLQFALIETSLRFSAIFAAGQTLQLDDLLLDVGAVAMLALIHGYGCIRGTAAQQCQRQRQHDQHLDL